MEDGQRRTPRLKKTLDGKAHLCSTCRRKQDNTMKRLLATAALAIAAALLALNCDHIGYLFAGGAILFSTGLSCGYCFAVRE